MRLFLSSQDLGNHADVAAKMSGDNKKSLFIKNAQDDKLPEERNFSNAEKKKMFEDAGFEFEMLDLRDYFGKKDELEEKVKKAGSLWSSGGNTFILRRAMAASGLDEILKKLLAEDKILYGGWSAGAYIAAPSLHGIEFGDRPQPVAVPENYPSKETIWEGLDLVPFTVVPHYKSGWFDEEADTCIEYLRKYKMPYQSLEDGQVVIVDGDKVEVLK
jgi:dipeptidase E